MRKCKYIYGPIFSWRLGRSLGIDLLSKEKKLCTFDCLYCQLGKTYSFTTERSIFVPTSEIVEEIRKLPPLKIDYITFSGRGEPTLASNLGEMIIAVKENRKEKVAVITNSSLVNIKEVRNELSLADFVIAKLDAYSQSSFQLINNPLSTIRFREIVKGIKQFRKEYGGKLALQIMFIDENKDKAAELADLCRVIQPTEVQINTPLRPSSVPPLSKKVIKEITGYFDNISNVKKISVYETIKKRVLPLTKEETLKRRGKI